MSQNNQNQNWWQAATTGSLPQFASNVASTITQGVQNLGQGVQNLRQNLGFDKLNTWTEKIAENTAAANTSNTTMGFTQSAGYSPYDYTKLANNLQLEDAGGSGGGGGGGAGGVEGGGDGTGGTADPAAECIARGGLWDGTKCIPRPTGGATGTGGGTGDTGAAKVGDLKEENGLIVRFDGTQWVPVQQGSTREFITEDPATVAAREAEAMRGADADMPVDRYMEALGTNTLSGQAYQEILAQRLANLEEQRFSAGQAYGDIYEQARMASTARRGLSDVSGMTGGMADQAGARLSAAEMASLGQIGMGRESTMRGLEREQMAAPLAAFGDAQQIDQWTKAMEQYERQMGYEDTIRGRETTMFEQSQEDRQRALADADTARERQALQDIYSQQSINAQQRADILEQRDYWRGVLQDPANERNRELLQLAEDNLTRLDGQYAQLLADYSRLNEQAITASGGDPQATAQRETGGPAVATNPPQAGAGETQADVTRKWLDETFVGNPNIPKTRINDAVSAARELAPDDVPDDYNYANEIAFINRFFDNPSEVTLNDFNIMQRTALKTGVLNNTNQYLKHIGVNGVSGGQGGMIGYKLDFDDMNHRNFVQSLVDAGTIPVSAIVRTNSEYRINYTVNQDVFAQAYTRFLQGNPATLEDSEARWG